MNKISLKRLVVLGMILLLTGFAAYAFAHGGGNYMGRGGYGMMNGYHMGNGGHMWNNFSAEDQGKMQNQMNEFFSSTKGLREQYDKKQLELNQEYSNPEKDQAKIDTLQSELFDLNSKIEKERFEHMRGMQKLFADKAPGYNMGWGGRNGGCF